VEEKELISQKGVQEERKLKGKLGKPPRESKERREVDPQKKESSKPREEGGKPNEGSKNQKKSHKTSPLQILIKELWVL